MNKDLFEEWVALNEVVGEWRSRFDILREKLPKCKTRAEAVTLLRSEYFFERYPKLPEWLEETSEKI